MIVDVAYQDWFGQVVAVDGQVTRNDQVGIVLEQDLVVSNIVVSSIYLSQNYQGVSTVTTTASFSLLVLMKLCRSFQMAREDRHTVRARSAYMTEYTSFNILDVDQYRTFNNVVVAN